MSGTVHTCNPARDTAKEGLLADGCDRCTEHAASVEFSGVPLGLDDRKTALLWDRMLAVEMNRGAEAAVLAGYPSENDATVCRTFYRWAIWLERNVGGAAPWRPLHELLVAHEPIDG